MTDPWHLLRAVLLQDGGAGGGGGVAVGGETGGGSISSGGAGVTNTGTTTDAVTSTGAGGTGSVAGIFSTAQVSSCPQSISSIFVPYQQTAAAQQLASSRKVFELSGQQGLSQLSSSLCSSSTPCYGYL